MVFSVCAFAEPLGERQHSTMNQTSVNEHLEDGTYKSDKNLFCLFNSMYSATLTNLMYNVYSYVGKVAIRAEVIVWNDVFPNWIKNVDKTKNRCAIAIFNESETPIVSSCQITNYKKTEGLFFDAHKIEFIFIIEKSSFMDYLLKYNITAIALAPPGANSMLEGDFTLTPNPDESNNLSKSKSWFLSARNTSYRENLNLFTDKFATDATRNIWWKAFLKKIRWKEQIDFSAVMTCIKENLHEYWNEETLG